MPVSQYSESLKPACCFIKGNEPRNNALAGTGNPINEVVWRVSRLNFASRTADRIGIMKAKTAKN